MLLMPSEPYWSAQEDCFHLSFCRNNLSSWLNPLPEKLYYGPVHWFYRWSLGECCLGWHHKFVLCSLFLFLVEMNEMLDMGALFLQTKSETCGKEAKEWHTVLSPLHNCALPKREVQYGEYVCHTKECVAANSSLGWIFQHWQLYHGFTSLPGEKQNMVTFFPPSPSLSFFCDGWTFSSPVTGTWIEPMNSRHAPQFFFHMAS